MNKIYYPLILFYANNTLAATALSVTRKLESQGSKLAFQIGIVGLLLAGVYYALGRHDANDKLQKTLIGLFVIVGATIIAGTIKTWVG